MFTKKKKEKKLQLQPRGKKKVAFFSFFFFFYEEGFASSWGLKGVDRNIATPLEGKNGEKWTENKIEERKKIYCRASPTL